MSDVDVCCALCIVRCIMIYIVVSCSSRLVIAFGWSLLVVRCLSADANCLLPVVYYLLVVVC